MPAKAVMLRKRHHYCHRCGIRRPSSGPCPRKRWSRVRRFLASTAFGAMGPSYSGALGGEFVGAGHARESGGAARSSPLYYRPLR